MKIKELKKLARLFRESNFRLVLVGGCVRDSFLKIKTADVDVASWASPAQVRKICGSNYKVKDASPKLGTLIIEGEDFSCEYTPFRSEKYASSVSHSPEEVVFEQSIVKDAYRRDFTVNCIYKDILTNKIFDPYCGIKDVKKRKIKQIHSSVFDVDPLRILRMVRFASVLKFKIDRKTFQNAKLNAHKTQFLSSSRTSKELEKIIASAKPVGGVKNLMKLGILPKSKLKTFSIYHSLGTLAFDLFSQNEKECEKFLNKYCTSNKQHKEIIESIKFAKAFDKNPSLETIVNNENKLSLASKMIKNQKQLIKCLNEIVERKLPLDISQLAITGGQLKDCGVEPRNISKELNNLLLNVVSGKLENNKEELIGQVKGENK